MKMAKVLSGLRELANKLSMLPSVTIGRKYVKKQKKLKSCSLTAGIPSIHLFHLIYRSEVHLAAKVCVSQPYRTFSRSAAVCVLHTFVLEGRSSPEAQPQGGPQLFARRAGVGHTDKLL